MRTIVIGAGIVGSAVSHALLDAGHAVTLVDTDGRPGRATDANAGWIAHTDVMPLASPRVWRNLPRWLFDPLGPLTIRPAYLPRLLPWLVRFVLASSPDRIASSIAAIRSINAEALPAWKTLLKNLGLDGHLREKGILSVWRTGAGFQGAQEVLACQKRFGIPVEVLDREELGRLEPALQNVAAAVLYPDACHVADPAALAAALLARAVERGARRVHGTALAIETGAEGLLVRTDGEAGALPADRAVVAAGAWSRSFAKQLGDDVPLDTERGYNATFPPGSFGLSRPVMFEGEGFVATPLDSGDRIGGAVEFGGLEAAPDHRRTEAMVERAKRFLPRLDPSLPAKRWMGFRPSIPDSLPVIGPARRDPRVIYAFGHGHYGLTQAAVTARIVAALAEGHPGPVDPKPFSAQRF
ncbi:NAD(P)/FAD-dependent oxidoreductase [Microvirga thermotolerans]|uniref:FAD-dependent oxidoreductase n=1 Tax=Microvirga thermotolerans TaxID=2651334 RepID=A0A5P9JQG1_9HYPH|nr:FAD-dependent oxidoreductase [Microvirga thermotolerans]QFU15002.1 FAD-dependent oxidoreductase [Microvirga thermotolerans]